MASLSENAYLIFNNNTIIEVDRSAMSFITLLPLRSMPAKNWKETDEATRNIHLNDIVKPLLSSLDVFEIPTMFNKGNLGTTYKVVHYYERHTKLQRGMMSDASISTRINTIGNDQVILEKEAMFLKSKMDLKAETIANYEHYDKTDFLVVKTMFRHDKVITGEERVTEEGDVIKIEGLSVENKKALLQHFNNYTKSKFKKDKPVLDSLFVEHTNRYDVVGDSMIDHSIKITQENLISWYSKISLSTSKTSVEDLNFIDNNILNYSEKPSARSTEISPADTSAPIKIIDFYPEKVTILNRLTNKTKIFKVASGEKIIVNETPRSIDVSRLFYKNGVKRISKIDSTQKTTDMNVKTGNQKSVTKSYFLTALPPFIKEDFSLKLADDLIKVLSPETFTQHIELFRLPQKQLIAQYESKVNALMFFSMFPHLNGHVYDKMAVLDKIEALTASINQVAENNFLSCRYSFGYTKRIDSQKDEVEISNKLKRLGVDDYSEAVRSLNKVTLPWSFTPYLINKAARSSYIELSTLEISKFINLKKGQKTLSFDRPTKMEDVAPIKKSCFFIKTENEVMGIDIFKGPEKYNGLIIAPSGSGKSFFAVNMLDGFISANKNNIVWILDRGGSFTRFTDGYRGVNKELTLSSDKNSINPFGLTASFVMMVKLQFFEELLNKDLYGEEGATSRKDKLTDEIELEIRSMIRYLKILSSNTSGSLFIVDDENSLEEYHRMPDSARQKLDIFRFIVNEDRSVDIKTEFFITQVQDTFAVLSSIVISMLSSKEKNSDINTVYFAMTPIILRRMFINKLNKSIAKLIFVEDYDNSTGETTSVFSFDKITEVGYENHQLVDTTTQSKTEVKFKFDDEIIEESNKNIYFIIEELKMEFENYIEQDKNIRDKDGALLHLKELDFYINELQAGKLFNVEPPKDLSNERLVNIDLGESQDERLTTVVPSALMMNFFKILTAPSKKGINKILLIDEAHAILGSTNTSGLDAIAYLFRTARKHGGAVWLISQSIGDFHQPNDPVKAQKFEALVKNAGWRVLLGSGHVGADDVLGFSGDSVEFAKKSKEGSEKFKMIIDMDGKTISVADLVVSATDYWNSTTHPAEKQVLDVLTLVTRDPQFAKMIASTTFNSATGGMRDTYASIAALEEANPAPSVDDVYESLKERTGIDYSEVERLRIQSMYRTIHAIISETSKKQISIKS